MATEVATMAEMDSWLHVNPHSLSSMGSPTGSPGARASGIIMAQLLQSGSGIMV